GVFELDQHGPLLDGLAGADEDAGDDAGRIGPAFVLHLHGFDDDAALPAPDHLTRLDLDADHAPRHGGPDGARAGGGRGGGEGADHARAFVHDVGLERAASEIEGPAALPEAAGGELEGALPGDEVSQGRARQRGKVYRDRDSVHGDGVLLDDDLEGPAGEGHEVAPTSSAKASAGVASG